MRKVNVSVIESIADLKTAPRLTLTRQSQLGSLTPTKMVQCYSCDGVPLKYKKKREGLQFTSTGYLSLVLASLRICWAVPLGIV
jgi:hypothetical protein